MTIPEHAPNDFMIRPGRTRNRRDPIDLRHLTVVEFYDGSVGFATDPPRARSSAPTTTSARLIRCPDPDEA
jgi:hypothetical protein